MLKTRRYTGLVAKLDRLFSKYIRLKYANNGVVQCYTCGKLHSVKTIQCGHYISRKYWNLRWNEDNARPQCVKCNYYEHGNIAEFRERLIEEIGEEKLQLLHKFKKMQKPSEFELRLLIEEYTQKLKQLKKC